MDSWLRHMPQGMLLKSDPFASNLSDPQDHYTLARFSAERSLPYSESEPVRLDTFCDYGLAFQRKYAPAAEEAEVVALERNQNGFSLRLDNGQHAQARRVVVAVGVGPFRYVPDLLARLGEGRVSHSFDHHELGRFAGLRVGVVGRGASAIDLAGLLHEKGCDVSLITRSAGIKFGGIAQGGPRPLWTRIRHPSSGLGPSWRSRFSTDAPLVFHALPRKLRLEFVRRHLGPFAGGVMKSKVVGKVPLLLKRELVAAATDGAGVALTLGAEDGSSETFHCDHVIAATGFRTDVDCLGFLPPSLKHEVAVYEGAPVLSTTFESSVPGLYFIGPAAALSFGPMMRFTFGARFVARRLTRALVAGRRSNPYSPTSPIADAPARTRA